MSAAQLPTGVDPVPREDYLTDADFAREDYLSDADFARVLGNGASEGRGRGRHRHDPRRVVLDFRAQLVVASCATSARADTAVA